MKQFMRFTTIMTICMSLGLFTGCGGSSSNSDTVTTVACTNNAYYNSSTSLWQTSSSDTTSCGTISCSSSPYYNSSTATWQYSSTNTAFCTPTSSTVTTASSCSYNQAPVRTPINISSTNSSYHSTSGLYSFLCLNSAQLQQYLNNQYVVDNGSYYYVNSTYVQNNVYTYQYQHQLNPNETLAVIGVIALAYLILN